MTFFVAYADTEELHISRMQKVDFKHIYKESIEMQCNEYVQKKRNPVWSEMSMSEDGRHRFCIVHK